MIVLCAGIDSGNVLLDLVSQLSALRTELRTERTELRTELGSVKQQVGDVVAALKEGSESGFSAMSPTGGQYQAYVDSQVDDLLERYCGLTNAGGRRGISKPDPASGDMEWDGRPSVILASDWTPPAFNLQFTVYGHTVYSPPLAVASRTMTPTKLSPPAQYFGVLEYTAHSEWWRDIYDGKKRLRKGLLQRLEERLAVCIQRYLAAGNPLTDDARDVVAVVGVASPIDNRGDVEAVLSEAACPFTQLKRMMHAGRFVHFCLPAAVLMRSPPAVPPPVAGAE